MRWFTDGKTCGTLPRTLFAGALFATLALVGGLSCGDSGMVPTDPPATVATTVSVTPATATMTALGETVELSAVVLDQNGQVMAGATVTWSSADASVATVDGDGVVTGAGNGSAAIAATAGSASGSAAITVAQAISAVQLSPAADTLVAFGDTVRITAEATDANGHPVVAGQFSWSSSDASVATVDGAGVVTGAGNGSAAITATAGSASGSAAITVAQAISAVQLSPAADTLVAFGDTVRIAAEATDANGHPVVAAQFSWESSDASVAAVDAAGLVTAAGNGSTVVAANAGGASGAAALTVKQSPASLTVSPAEAVIFALGDTLRLGAEAFDANGHPVAGAEVSWESGDDAVATVDGLGLVAATGNGNVVVTAYSEPISAMVSVAVMDVAQFLGEKPRVAAAMVWLGTDDQYRPYSRWPQRMKESLVSAVVSLVGEGTGLPEVMTNQAAGFLNDDQLALSVYTREDAEAVYMANIAHSLVVEMNGTVPWSLDDLPDRQLEMLLGSQGFFHSYGSVIAGAPRGYIVSGYTGPAPPDIIRDFIHDNDLVRGSRYETIARMVEWTRHHLVHFACWLTAENAESHWDYRGTPPLARMLAGTRRGDRVINLGESECRTYADTSTKHYTAGCHGTAWFFTHVLRAVNIPVDPPESYYSVCAGHAAVSFPSEDMFLSHGDDPYNRNTWYSPPFPEPFSSSEILVPGSKFRQWFNTSNSPEENRNNVGRTIVELAVAHLPQLLLHWRCQDLSDGRSLESSRVYHRHSTGIGHHWTLAELEDIGFWERLDAKIERYGGCPIAHPGRLSNQWTGIPSPDILRSVVDAPVTGFNPAGTLTNVCLIDPRYLHLVQRGRE